MSHPTDLTGFLKDWEYNEEDNVRFLTGEDGREIMQIRQPLGIEQYDLDGRPDGLRPEGKDSELDLFLEKERTDRQFVLNMEDFQRLRNEGVLFYFRYLALFQVGHYDRVARDTDHNLEICRFLEQHFPGSEKDEMLQYRPYILRMNAISKAMMFLAEEKTAHAMEALEKGKTTIEALSPVSTPIYEFEKIRSLQHLSQVVSQVHDTEDHIREPKGFKARLFQELSKAVENEDYERAARLRDRIKRLE
ncbi:MAG: UvrB/UvrC motif-containing protein [Spirochaetaceae bacterium]|nr:UvrB/UvrC motif-containing protein [Spirochaetaceae bacterium]